MGLDVSMFLSFTEAIAWAKARGVVLPDVYYGSKIGIARAESFSVAGLASLDQLELIKQSLDTATAEGIGFADWKKLVTADNINLTLANHRLDNIFRTNIQGAYMAGRWDSIQANKDDRAYLMYDAVNDSRTRPAHKAMDNIIKPVGDVFWKKNYPPNGYRCRCSVISLTAAQAKKRGGVTDDNDIPDEAKADKGWDYNGGEARFYGIKQALAQKLERCKKLGFSAYNECNKIAISLFDYVKKATSNPNPTSKPISDIEKVAFTEFALEALNGDTKRTGIEAKLGFIPDYVMANELVKSLDPKDDVIFITDHQLAHGKRPFKSGDEEGQKPKNDATLPIDVLTNLPDYIERGVWVYDESHHNLLVFFYYKDDSSLGKAVIQINFMNKKTKKEGNNPKTTGTVLTKTAEGEKKYKIISAWESLN